MKDDFGDLLSKTRASAGMSLRDLQRATTDKKHKKGISIGLLSMIENGERPATYETVYILAKALSIELDVAMLAAYRSRVVYCMKKEEVSLKVFLKKKRMLRKLGLEKLTYDNHF